MHFLLSLLYLLLVALLLFGYVCVFILSFRYIKQTVGNIYNGRWSWTMFFPAKSLLLKRSRLLTIAIICLAVTIGSYIYERNRWVMPDSAHRDAKNYLVTGMVLLEYRTIGAAFTYPERLLWKPTVWLQHLISNTGQALLPDNDGEHAIWQYYFVLAPYINRLHAPRTPEIYLLIDTAEKVLKILAEKKIRDREFRVKQQYLIYPLVSLFYVYSYKGMYFIKPQTKCYYEGLYKDPEQAKRLKQIVDWSVAKEAEWKGNPEVLRHMKEHPDLELVQIVSVSILLQEILRYQVLNLEYSCQDRYLDLYYDYVGRYVAEDSPYHLVDRNMQKRFNNPVLYHSDGLNFFGHRLCNRPKLPAYNVRSVADLGQEVGWGDAFRELNRKLVPPEKQAENLKKIDPWE